MFYRGRGGRFTTKAKYQEWRRRRTLHRKAKAYLKKHRLAALKPLVGWETIERWKSYLLHEWPGLVFAAPVPRLLKWTFPTEEAFWLWTAKQYPPPMDSYIVLAVWFVVEIREGPKDDEPEYELWTRAERTGAGLLPDELTVDAARLVYERGAELIERKMQYVKVREFVGWTAAPAKRYNLRTQKGAWFRSRRRKITKGKRAKRRAGH